MAKFSAGRGIIDLRKKRLGSRPSGQKPLSFSFTRRKREGLRTRRMRARIWAIVFIFSCVVVVVAMLHYLSFMPSYNVQSIVATGASRTAAIEIEEYAYNYIHRGNRLLFSSSNIFLYQPSLVRDALLTQFPPLKSARVGRSSPLSTTVEIALEEREAYALWCGSVSRCYDIDKDGFVFARSGAAHTAPYVFYGGLVETAGSPIGSHFAEGHFEWLLTFLKLLEREGFVPEGASVENERDMTIQIKNSFYLKASFGESAQDLVKNLQLVLASDTLKDKDGKIEYIDLRFGDRVYYKFRGVNETKITPN